jgi:hypothetical protein
MTKKKPRVCIRCRRAIRKRLEAPKTTQESKPQSVPLLVPLKPESPVYDNLMNQGVGCYVYEYDPSTRLTRVWKNKWLYGTC